MAISYLFREPQFPIICAIGGKLISAKSKSIFQSRMVKEKFESDKSYHAVDVTGQAWDLYSDYMFMSPSLSPRRWSKKDVVRSYNTSENYKKIQISYSEKSLSGKRYEKVFSDIFDLVEKSLNSI